MKKKKERKEKTLIGLNNNSKFFIYLTYTSQVKAQCYPLPHSAWEKLQWQPCSSCLCNIWDLLGKLRKRLI